MQSPALYLAPIRGITDHVFRSLLAEHFGGFDLAVAPFIASKQDNVFKARYVKDVLPENNRWMPVVPQILSKSAVDFTLLANYLFALGYDTVNWNLGCPYPTVANKQRGSGMLPHTDRIRAFLDHACAGLRGRMSIKLRLGWQSNDDIFVLLPLFNQYPLASVIIHPRTGVQRYGGRVDLDAFGRCLAICAHPVVYNGDICTPSDFAMLASRFKEISGWMIGRGAVADPFLASAIKGGRYPETGTLERMRRFHDHLFDAYAALLGGPAHVMDRMKGFWRYFSMSFKDCEKAMKTIRKARGPHQYQAAVARFFDTDAVWRSIAERGDAPDASGPATARASEMP